MRTVVTLFFLFHPSLSSQLSPGRNGTEDNFLTYREGEIFYELAGEIITLMTPLETFLLHTGPDRTDLAVFEQIVGETPLTVNFFQTDPIYLG